MSKKIPYLKKTEWEEKVWGRVCHIFESENAAVSHLEVKAGYRCSRHYHQHRANMFYVQEGKIVVEVWNGWTRTMADLVPGYMLVVPSKIEHRFNVVESGKLIEVYWPDQEGGKCEFDDIVRLESGGEWDGMAVYDSNRSRSEASETAIDRVADMDEEQAESGKCS